MRRLRLRLKVANYGRVSLKGKKLKWKLDMPRTDVVQVCVAGTLTHLNQPPLAQGEITIHTD